MSKKQSLKRAIALSLILSMPCYISAWAAPNGTDGTDGADVIKNNIQIGASGINDNDSGNGGTDGTSGTDGSYSDRVGGNGGRGGNGGSYTASYQTSEQVTGGININGSGGDAGRAGDGGRCDYDFGGSGGDGGTAGATDVSVTLNHDVDTNGAEINIKVRSNLGGDAGEGGYAPVNGGAGGAGGDGGAASSILYVNAAVKAGNVTIQAGGGRGGNGASGNSGISGMADSGAGGDAGAAIAGIQHTGQLSIAADKLDIIARGGIGGDGGGASGIGSSYADGADGGVGGAAEAYGFKSKGGSGALSLNSVTIQASGGMGGVGGNNDNAQQITAAGIGGVGGRADASVLQITDNSIISVQITNDSYIIAVGGAGAAGGGGRSSAVGGNGGAATAYAMSADGGSQLTVTMGDSDTRANSGFGGEGGYNVKSKGGVGGASGTATATGFWAANAGSIELDAGNVSVSSASGYTGKGGSGGSYDGIYIGTEGGNGGVAAASVATALSALQSGVIRGSTGSIDVRASSSVGGEGGQGGEGYMGSSASYNKSPGYAGGAAGIAGSGGVTTAYGLHAEQESTIDISTQSIYVGATSGQGGAGGTGGKGGRGGEAYSSSADNQATDGGMGHDGGNGADAGLAKAYALYADGGSKISVQATNISVIASGGQGGKGGQGGAGGTGGLIMSYAGDKDGGNGGDGANGGDGGNGGNALAYGSYAAGNSQVSISADSITVSATGGAAGQGGAVGAGGSGGAGNGTGVKGQDGQAGTIVGAAGIGGTATAYGVYAKQGATVTLAAKNAGNALEIGVSAAGIDAKAYSIYADGASVFFGSDVNINKDKDLNADNSVATYIQDSTLGFVDGSAGSKDAGRTVTGGSLQLAGSNTLRFATDLANNTADKMTFDSLATNSTAADQYITVAYDKSFDGSSLAAINGKATVLHFDNLNGNDLSKFIAKASAFDTPLESFIATPIIEIDGNDVNITSVDFGSNGDSESVMAASDSHMSLGSILRVETNNLMKRMGELRSDPEATKGGVWARYYRGKQTANGAYERSFGQTYTAFQGGIDRVQEYKDGRLVTGLMVNRIDATASYHSGSGDMSSTGMGLYASWLGGKGHYIDVIARASKLNNNFKLVDKSGNFASGDYSTWAYGISAEYGYRQQLTSGWFIEPQAELTFTHMNSAGYTMSNGLQVNHDAVNSTIGRIGFVSGKAFQAGGRAGNAYIKASLLHEFGGKEGGQAYYQGKGLDMVGGDLGGTWYELGVGANLGLAKNTNFYMDALKTFNGKVRTNWQFNAGVRVSF